MRMEDGMGAEREGGRMVATDDGISAPARTEIPQRAVIYRCREKQNGKLLAATLREAEEGALNEASEVSRPIHGFQIVLPTLSFQQAPRAKKIDGLHQCGTRGVINHDALCARHQTISHCPLRRQARFRVLTMEPSSIVSRLMTVTWKETSVAAPGRKRINVNSLCAHKTSARGR